MDEGLIARRYAKAMFHYAQELNIADVMYGKMKLFEKNYMAYPNLQKALLNPLLSPKDKERLLSTAIGIEPEDAYIQCIRLLIKNHREMYMRSICLMFQKIYRTENGIIRVKIITAMELSETTVEKIKEFVRRHTDKAIEFVHKIDPSIIGGFILQVDSRQLDASLAKELKALSLQFGI